MTQIYEVSKNLQILLSFGLARWDLAIATTSIENNKQSSFTVKNPRGQLVKIDHVILVYLSLTGTTDGYKL